MLQNTSPTGLSTSSRSLWQCIIRNYDLYLFILPALIWYLVFTYGPLYGVQIAFKNFNGALGIWGSPWIGFKHFRNFLTAYSFPILLRNTILLSLYSLVAGFPFPILLALMLNELGFKRYKKIVQTVTYAPHFISMVVMIGMLTLFFSPSMGVFNSIREVFGLQSVSFLTRPEMFRHLYVWSGVWQGMGWGSIIYLAALSAVDPEQHEAAIIDGASRLQRIRYINIPVLLPTITILLILNCGSILSVGYEKVLLMQNDLILDTSEVISTYVYKRGLLRAEYSYSSAVGLFNNVVNVTVLLLVNTVVRKLGQSSLF
jgi:putative aldouronate transport system permease protein